MSYSVYNLRSDVFIPGEKKPAALAALLAALPLTADVGTLEEALATRGWECSSDDAENVVGLYLGGTRLGTEQKNVLPTIAPFVRPGSSVMFVGEDSALFGWEFIEVSGVAAAIERDMEAVFVRRSEADAPEAAT